MIEKLINLFRMLLKKVILSEFEKKLISNYKNRNHKNDLEKTNDVVLVQCVEDMYYWSLFYTITKKIKQSKNISIEQYVVRSLRTSSSISFRHFIASFIFSNYFSDKKWIKIYSTFCDRVAYKTTGLSNIILRFIYLKKAFQIWRSQKTKEDFLQLKIDGILVGDLIYDSYLRFKPAATAQLNDIYMLVVILQAIVTIKCSNRYFLKKRPILYLSSYSTYIQHGIPVRVAISIGVKVYTFGNMLEFGKSLSPDDYFHVKNGSDYYADFQKFNDKNSKINTADDFMKNRFSGGIDYATFYMKESAYKITENEVSVPDVTNSVVIFLHDFFDSPHIYKWMVFPDFWEWILFTINTLIEHSIPFHLKAHPNQILMSNRVVKQLKIMYPNLSWIPASVSNLRLVESGMKCGVTVYGTVCHEMAYLGVPIIACGDHPHVAFDFTYTAKSKSEYKEYLRSYLTLEVNKNKNKLESLIFYYMHNLNNSQDDFYVLNICRALFKALEGEGLSQQKYIKLTESIDELLHSSIFKRVSQKLLLES